jgi:hypothetical protein
MMVSLSAERREMTYSVAGFANNQPLPEELCWRIQLQLSANRLDHDLTLPWTDPGIPQTEMSEQKQTGFRRFKNVREPGARTFGLLR